MTYIYGLITVIAIIVIWRIRTNPTDRLSGAVDNIDVQAVQTLLDQGLNPDLCHYGHATPLYLAALRGQSDMTELLIEYGADVNSGLEIEDGMNPLLAAKLNEHDAIVQLLLQHGARGGLHYAAYLGQTQSVIDGLEQGYELNSKRNRGLTPLHLACLGGHEPVVDLLISRGADINACSPAGASPLHQAVNGGHLGLVRYLADAGASLDACATLGTPLNFAIQANHVTIAQLLISLGADVNGECACQSPPLHNAARLGNLELVQCLIASGANVNGLSRFAAYTPLHFAAENGNVAILQALLDHHADPNLRNTHGCTPLQYCRDVEGQSLLINYGAEYGVV